MIKAICIGHATYDITIRTQDIPKPGTIHRYEHKIGCGGGVASNIAYMLAKWGIETTFSGVVGNDVYGQRIKKELDSVKIDTRYLETTYDNDTDLSITFINSETNEKMNFTLADNFTYLKKFEYDFTPDLIVTDGYDLNASKTVLGQYPKAISLLDAKELNQNILDLCKRVHFIICSKEFAEAISGITIDFSKTETLIQAYERIKTKFEKAQIVITLGEHGALYCIKNQIKVSPALKLDNVDSTGSGDIFKAAFLYTIANGGDIEKAVKFGNIAAGISIQKVGARYSIPRLEEVTKLYEKNY